ncbi:MoaD/ThiS family protein [Sinomonas halotolerans]|uniref:MoaD/ThiS family protein n=1 Tax=Sinomonas halotolerans TaxID=1644133 RepID=A0ABU9X0D5_9MICC
MAVTVVVPSVLAAAAGGRSSLEVPAAEARTVGEALDAVGREYPILGRRLRNERGTLRRHVNAYVGGEDVRRLEGLATPVRDGQEVLVVQSIAGG